MKKKRQRQNKSLIACDDSLSALRLGSTFKDSGHHERIFNRPRQILGHAAAPVMEEEDARILVSHVRVNGDYINTITAE